ncbi:MAG: hypothetical protein QOJ39_2653 [Candidatus Eremiobacteraeota bacterium]|jgi:hypothetical protein|nr:hypothetical protein [Candidatus Eremiobacteraeota bacterium]
MIARLVPFALAAFIAATGAASAQSTKQPQTPPNPGAAEAQPSTVRGPGGYTTEPAPQQGTAPATYGTDPNSGNDFTASPKLGPQQNLGQRINHTVHYVAGDYIAPPLIYNAFAGPAKGDNYRSYAVRAAFEVPLGQYDVYVGGEGRKYQYSTRTGLVTGIGPQGIGFVPSFTAVDYDYDVRAGLKVTGPRVYGAVSYLTRGSNFEPRQHGIGYGIEKLADVDQNFSLHGNVFFYPNVNGQYSVGGAGSRGVSYREVRYTIGASIQPNHSPLFLDAGFLGDRSNVRTDAPVGFNHQGPYVGVGIHF